MREHRAVVESTSAGPARALAFLGAGDTGAVSVLAAA